MIGLSSEPVWTNLVDPRTAAQRSADEAIDRELDEEAPDVRLAFDILAMAQNLLDRVPHKRGLKCPIHTRVTRPRHCAVCAWAAVKPIKLEEGMK